MIRSLLFHPAIALNQLNKKLVSIFFCFKINKMKPVICIGSTSSTKLEAVKNAFEWYDVKFETCKVKCANQPVGKSETLREARHQAHESRKIHPDAMMWIGIKSGMIQTQNGWHDIAAIVILDKNTEYEIWTKPLPIPISRVSTKLRMLYMKEAIMIWLTSEKRKYKRKSKWFLICLLVCYISLFTISLTK